MLPDNVVMPEWEYQYQPVDNKPDYVRSYHQTVPPLLAVLMVWLVCLVAPQIYADKGNNSAEWSNANVPDDSGWIQPKMKMPVQGLIMGLSHYFGRKSKTHKAAINFPTHNVSVEYSTLPELTFSYHLAII